MKLGIMQPYFFPYIGYWQLMNAVDQYVIYDDVNFIKGGWVNRNRILVNGQPAYINLPISKASQNKLINELNVDTSSKLICKGAKRIEQTYKKAPFFCDVFPIVEDIINCREQTVSAYLFYSFRILCRYLGIHTNLVLSSSLKKECNLHGQDKILEICKILHATEYYNAIGGQALYSYEAFKQRGIALRFLQTDPIRYEQFGGEFQPNLSIIDVMMFNSVEQIQLFLNNFKLL